MSHDAVPIGALLIANRGEIARRIIRTARRMGIRTIAVHAEADAAAPYVREADGTVAIGPSPASESYLVAERLLDAARRSGARAIHPGYGFLSENAAFAEAVIAEGLIWVGPPPEAIRAMGLKDAAKRLMTAAGVPVTPGYLGDDQSAEALSRHAAGIGFPVLIKAVAGGGGKGMRAVRSAAEFGEALAAARREASSSFGDDRVLLEKLVASPRHIEVQIFRDRFGAAVHMFERDCSLQRRHQKVIEEAPAPGMDEATRAALCEAAIRAAHAVDYQGAGTVEFIADASEGLHPDRMWFMEMNTRLQVEHPVTEAITGLDLVEWQLRIAAGEPLPLTQAGIGMIGHAIEARLYAEDPARGFLPSVGPIRHLRLPESVRVDSGVEAGGAISPFYDPMIAKLIAHADNRATAAALLATAARAVEVWPVRTNAGFLARCLEHPVFLAGRMDTGLIEADLADLTRPEPPRVPPGLVAHLAGAASDRVASPEPGPWNPFGGLAGFRINAAPVDTALIHVDGQPTQARFDFRRDVSAPLHDEDGVVVFSGGVAFKVSLAAPDQAGSADGLSTGAVVTPMPGRIVSVAVAVGDPVSPGQTLVVLEAMKMEHALTAPAAARVGELFVTVGDQVSEGLLVARLEPIG